jgi:fructokinase
MTAMMPARGVGAGGRVTVVGEALVDLLWPAGAAQVSPVPGGSPANVAVGLDRLGRAVPSVTTWGDDPPGEQISGHLAASGWRWCARLAFPGGPPWRWPTWT